MTFRPASALCAVLAASLLAAPAATQDSKQQDPKKPTVISSPLTPEQKAAKIAEEKAAGQEAGKSTQDVLNPLTELQNELARTKTELEATARLVREGGILKAVTPYFADRKLDARSVKVEIKAQPAVVETPAAAPTATARMMTTDEKATFGEDVVAVIDGEPIHKAEVDDMVTYYKGTGTKESDDEVAKRALRALVMQKGALAAFKGKAPEKKTRIDEIRKMLADGADFAETAKKLSQCPSAAQGGDLGTFGRGMMDPMFEKAAYSLKLGQVSDVVQSAFGYHIIKATGYEKGQTPDQDQVRASHILVMFDDDQNTIRNKMGQLMQGKGALLLRDDEWMKRNPFAR
ncbi:MAG: peptidylprolyl isomerase [Planctomycetota bacterium]